jgi:hypothetical protein
MSLRSKARIVGLVFGLASVAVWSPAPAQQKAYRLPGVDLKQQVLWGTTCDGPNGTGLAFGGQDQKAGDGQPHTRIKVNGAWEAIHEDLCKKNPLQKYHERCQAHARQLQVLTARTRSMYLQGLSRADQVKQFDAKLLPLFEAWEFEVRKFRIQLEKEAWMKVKGYEQNQSRRALGQLDPTVPVAERELAVRRVHLSLLLARQMSINVAAVAEAAACFAPEPPPRALTAISYDDKTKLYVLFGGDHFDYLTNDTWVFDPAKTKWEQRHPQPAPPPRANHTLKANGNGTVTLSGGYTYTSSTDYCGGQYKDIGDGDWTYDIAANTWTGKDNGNAPDTRVYRTGPFHPNFFLKEPKPDAAAFAKQLKDLPANSWLSTKPPHLPRLNRDWGTAVLDVDRDLILRFSGGHSAHGGSDVLHYHLASNRWELPFPVEFPLGQLYSNTSYPDGFNFNLRPWVTGHTYQNYGYDPVLKKLLFTGQPGHTYIYDPEVADWTGRFPKPPGMVYDSCFYTLTLCPTPRGLVCWQKDGRVFRLDAGKKEWTEQKLNGAKLPSAVVDNSTVVHDAKRDRLLFVSKPYGDKVKFSGEVHALDLKTLTVSALSPKGKEAAAAIPYLCQVRYDSENDLLLVGATLPPGEDSIRRTPAYDCAANAWVTLKLGGTDPSGKGGRNVSLGLMYDSKRKLFWAVDAGSNVFVLRLDPKTADAQPLR